MTSYDLTPFQIARKIENDIEKEYNKGKGEKSLFLLALERAFSECENGKSELDIIRNFNEKWSCPHARFAVFLYDFWSNSNGTPFWDYWRPHGLPRDIGNKARQFDNDWKEIFCTDKSGFTSEDDNARRAKVKSKCWILKGGENGDNKGDDSALWDCLRDAVDAYRDTGDVNAIRVNSNGDSRRRFVDLLFAKDSIERKEYCKLASLLANPELLSGEGSPWPELVEVCERHVQQTPRVDWYLRLDGDCAQYIVGVDNFPKQAGEWKLAIDNDLKRFRTLPCKSFPIPWDRPVPVDFISANKIWPTTLPEGASCCLETSASIPFSVFVHHRADSKDPRSYWWNQQTTPTLSRDKSEFIVCAKKKEVLEKLQIRLEKPGLELEDSSPAIETLWISNHPEERARETPFYGKRFKVVNRPENDDATINLSSGGGETLSVNVAGKHPFIEREEQADIQTDNLGFLVHKACGNPLSLALKNARQHETYRWTAIFGETRLPPQSGTNCRFTMNPPTGDSIVRFTVNCEDGQGKKVATAKGCILPPAVYGGLLSANPVNCVGGGWRAAAKAEDGIQDRINGFRQYELADTKGEKLFVRIPIHETELNWWFEEGHNAFSDMNPRPALLSRQTPLRQFEPAEMTGWSLCLPPDVRCPVDWGKYLSGYWRIPLSKLIEGRKFSFNPHATFPSYLFDGMPLFQYNPQPSTRRLCRDCDGNLGLFVPKTDQATYDIVAYADDDGTILTHGKELATTKTGDLFTPIEDLWQSFCSEHEKNDHQAFLIVFEHGVNHRLDFSSVARSLEKQNDTGRFWPEEWTQPTEKQLPSPPVYDSQVLYAVIDMRERYKDAPDNFPLRRANFFRSIQKQCYEEIKNSWGKTVAAWNEGSAEIEDVAFRIIREWEDAGFCPILEPDAWIAIRHWLKGTDKIPWMAPAKYRDASDWWGFFRAWTTNDAHLDSKSLEPKSLFWQEAITRAGAKRSKLSIGCLRQLIQQARKYVFKSPDGRTYQEWIKVFRRDNNVNNLIGYVLHLEQIPNIALPNGITTEDVGNVEAAVKDLARKVASSEIRELINVVCQRQGQKHDIVGSPTSRTLFCLAMIAAMADVLGRFGRPSPLGHDSDQDKNPAVQYAAVRKAFSLIRNDTDGRLWNDFCIRELQCERLIEALSASN